MLQRRLPTRSSTSTPSRSTRSASSRPQLSLSHSSNLTSLAWRLCCACWGIGVAISPASAGRGRLPFGLGGVRLGVAAVCCGATSPHFLSWSPTASFSDMKTHWQCSTLSLILFFCFQNSQTEVNGVVATELSVTNHRGEDVLECTVYIQVELMQRSMLRYGREVRAKVDLLQKQHTEKRCVPRHDGLRQSIA